MTAITPAQFRANFPEFNNQTRYPTGLIQFWMDWSYLMLNANRFKPEATLNMAAQLFTAHNLVIERLAQDQALLAANAQAGAGGRNSGPIASKSVDKTAVAYDNAIANDPSAGYWNQTSYGARLWQLIRMFGAGPYQSGACGGFLLGNIAGWPGFWPGWA